MRGQSRSLPSDPFLLDSVKAPARYIHMMMLATILGLLLLAAWLFAQTSPTFVPAALEQAEQDLAAAQDWVDELEASLCPMQRAVDLGILPCPWTMSTKLATLLSLATEHTATVHILTAPRTHHAHAA